MSQPDLQIDPAALLPGMYRDGYFPNDLVDQVRDVLLDACRRIEVERPANLDALYALTEEATERINDLQDVFEERDSEIETVARDDIGLSFLQIARTYGFEDADPEELIAARDW
ncbi:MAG: DUF5713 family protein [Planctomycetota bacterium]